jgi:transposase
MGCLLGNPNGCLTLPTTKTLTHRLGHITREGAAVVRQLVAEAAWQAQRRSPSVRAYFERAQRGDPQRKKIALVATAHYLVRVMWALLKRGTVWEERTAS